MPAVSIDTFFACTLMVIVVLSAMAGTSKLLSPYINNPASDDVAGRYKTVSDYMLLNDGSPPDWGTDRYVIPDSFGLADRDSNGLYDLDIDKISRLNSENSYSLTYPQMFTSLGFQDVAFRLEIKPIFDVTINLTRTFASENETTYEFTVYTTRAEIPIEAALKCYAIVNDHLIEAGTFKSFGTALQNATLPNSMSGSALFLVFAKEADDDRIASFNAYTFAHNCQRQQSKDAFVKLSPLNYTLTVNLLFDGTTISTAYATSFGQTSTLTPTIENNDSVIYEMPHWLIPSPMILILFGTNSTDSFVEWVSYPQVPLEIGANFEDSTALSDIHASTYIVMIDSIMYECRTWLGGPRE